MKKKALRKLYCCIGLCLRASPPPPPPPPYKNTQTCALIEAQLRNDK